MFSLSEKGRLAVKPLYTGTSRRPALGFYPVPSGSDKQSHHRSINNQSKRADADAGRQLAIRIPSQIAQAMLLEGGETFDWRKRGDGVAATSPETDWYSQSDDPTESDNETGVSEAAVKAYGSQEQFRTYIPKLPVNRLQSNLKNDIPSHLALRLECRKRKLRLILDADHSFENPSSTEKREIAGYPISLQFRKKPSHSQINLSFPKQIAHGLELTQEAKTVVDEDGSSQDKLEVSIIKWEIDPLNNKRLQGSLTRRVQDKT